MSSIQHVAFSDHAAGPIGAQQLVAWSRATPGSLVLMLGETERRQRFAYALQRALQAREMSERQLALRLKIDARTVAKWRTGRSLPDLYQTLALAETLKVSENLFRDPPAVPPPPPEPYYPIEKYLLGAVEKGAARGQQASLQVDEDDAEPGAQRPQRLG